MLAPVFTLQLNNKVYPGTFSVGKFNGKRPCLVGATTGNKVLIHSSRDVNPHAQQLDGNISLLNVNQIVTSLACGRLDESSEKDTLVVGTGTNIIAYDLDQNVDLFFQEVQDGAHEITIGNWGELPERLAIVGGNCSIHGFNKRSEDTLWTVTGDNVSSLALLDFNSDGFNELIVGSEDFNIRVFREDQLMTDIQETDTVVSLCSLINARFGYALSNGTIGIYERSSRHWRIKSRNIAIVLQAYDINGDGIDELITGWSNGKVDVRNDRNGDVIFKDTLHSAISGVVKSDYRVQGENLLVCCTNEGEVRGYQFSDQDSNALATSQYKNNQDAMRTLYQKKLTLLAELENLEAAVNNTPESNSTLKPGESSADIPVHTEILTTLSVEQGNESIPGHVAVKMMTSNHAIIRLVTVFAEGVFQGECFVIHPAAAQVRENIIVPIILPRDAAVDLTCQIFVGLKASTRFHVFELQRPLPAFSMYMLIESTPSDEPRGFVTFSINERIQRILLWINNHFLFAEEYAPSTPNVHVTFLSVRTNIKLVIKMQNTGQVTIQTDDMELAGNIVQSIGKFLNVEDLQTAADFPSELEILEDVFLHIEEYQKARQRISSDMAEHAGVIRNFLIRAEDARLIGDISNMKQYYVTLFNLNRDLINGYQIRCTNHEEVLKNLRYLNQIIQRAGNLRIGKYKTNTVNHCRAAIKANNVTCLIKSIKTGNV